MRIYADNKAFQYSGRIDFDDPKAPVLVYACSYVKAVFTGRNIKAILSNRHNCYTNYMGVIIDGEQRRITLDDDRDEHIYSLAEGLDDGEHELILFKRMDGGAHYVVFGGLILDEGAVIKKPYSDVPERRIEVIGDSVSCGEVCEALDCLESPDPENNHGQFSNGWFSYSWQVARNLGADLHDTSQGGISLFDGTGWFNGPDDLRGVESTYKYLEYNPPLGLKEWDFKKWIPHVVVLAFGQNDANPVNFMEDNYDGAEADRWREGYKNFILNLQKLYPGVTVICTTTLLMHHPNWDKAIDQVVKELNMAAVYAGKQPLVHHFMYKRNGAATPGHPRIPEHDEMAAELTACIKSLGQDIWKDRYYAY